MSTKRRLGAEFKAKVTLVALHGDKTIHETAAWHKVHPNRVSAWIWRAVEGMREILIKQRLRAGKRVPLIPPIQVKLFVTGNKKSDDCHRRKSPAMLSATRAAEALTDSRARCA